MQTEFKAGFATFDATADALRKLNMEEHGMFLRPDSLDAQTGEFFLNCKAEVGQHEVIGRIYECRNSYHCVAVDEDIWQAPIVWNGPRASWDTSTDAETLTEFAAFIRKALTEKGLPMNLPDNHLCNVFASDVGDYDRFSPAAAIVCAEKFFKRGCALRINVKGADRLKSVRFGPDDAQTIEQECDLDQFQLFMMHACVAFPSQVRIVYEMKDGRVIPSAASQWQGAI